jgi:REP element-mobilizing transposase RayT
MPRHGRIDIAGQLYHVIARGNERKVIFSKKEDCNDFISRLKINLEKTGNKCLAWSLIPNHFHLLILRGDKPLAELMRRLMTGYAISFNLRHKRVGHLFQNRYKAILCDEEEYLRDLVAYIHLNPYRAGLVKNLSELEKYPWCGHGALLGKAKQEFLERDYILGHFGGSSTSYETFVKEHEGKYHHGDYSGGGLIKSMGGLLNVLGMDETRDVYDDRIFGNEHFVENILRKAGEEPVVMKTSAEVLKEAAEMAGISQAEILRPGHGHKEAEGRAIYCYMAKEKAGVGGAALCSQLGLTRSGISRLVEKGRRLLCARGK